MLRPLLSRSGSDPVFQRTFARAAELAGDTNRAAEAYAEAAFLNGHPEQALIQLETLKKHGGLDYVTRARVDAGSSPSPRPCWSCAGRASATRTCSTEAPAPHTGRGLSQFGHRTVV